MQSHLRCMVSGFANTSLAFPMANELANQIAEFYKCECFDIFFDVLSQELNMKGIIFFFQTSMRQIDRMINDYFQPLFAKIAEVTHSHHHLGWMLHQHRRPHNECHEEVFPKQLQANLSQMLRQPRTGTSGPAKESEAGKRRADRAVHRYRAVFI